LSYCQAIYYDETKSVEESLKKATQTFKKLSENLKCEGWDVEKLLLPRGNFRINTKKNM
jgi:hypothetical protein